jgi:ATP-dependent helicase/nuclease subunit A
MIRTTLASGLLERARASVQSGKRVLRELPFVRPAGCSAIEEGKIDLLFEEEAGWVLVDYKTDWVQPEAGAARDFFKHKYTGQIREYLEALQALAVKVHSAYLLLARTGQAIPMV